MIDVEVIEMYEQGLQVTKICAEAQIYPQQLYAVLDRNGVPRRGHIDRRASTPHVAKLSLLTQEQEVLLAEGFKKGKSVKEMATGMGISYPKMLAAAKAMNLNFVPGAKQKPISVAKQKQIVADYLDADITMDDLAAKHGLSITTLYRILKGNGIKKLRESPGAYKNSRMEVLIDAAVKASVREMKKMNGEDVEQLGFDFPSDLGSED